jgi:hypothetical protein
MSPQQQHRRHIAGLIASAKSWDDLTALASTLAGAGKDGPGGETDCLTELSVHLLELKRQRERAHDIARSSPVAGSDLSKGT